MLLSVCSGSFRWHHPPALDSGSIGIPWKSIKFIMEQELRWYQQLHRFHEGKGWCFQSCQPGVATFLLSPGMGWWDGTFPCTIKEPGLALGDWQDWWDSATSRARGRNGNSVSRWNDTEAAPGWPLQSQDFPQTLGKPSRNKKIKDLDHPGCCWSIEIIPKPQGSSPPQLMGIFSSRTPCIPKNHRNHRDNLLWDSKFRENVAGRGLGILCVSPRNFFISLRNF